MYLDTVSGSVLDTDWVRVLVPVARGDSRTMSAPSADLPFFRVRHRRQHTTTLSTERSPVAATSSQVPPKSDRLSPKSTVTPQYRHRLPSRNFAFATNSLSRYSAVFHAL